MPKKLLSSENHIEKEFTNDSNNEKIQLSYDQKLQLEEQIRKFVQLLTQIYLLSCTKNEFSLLNESSKEILEEYEILASENSIFNAYNLNGALNIVREFSIKEDGIKFSKVITGKIKNIIVDSDVFMYPELLPTRFFSQGPNKKVTFTKAEDNLIALGLERFSEEFDPFIKTQIHYIPCKTVHQIRIRVKNLKCSKAPKDNPVKHYYTYKRAPPMPRNVQIFDSNKVKAPKYHNPTDLPEWIVALLSSRNEQKSKIIIQKPIGGVYRPILPKGVIIQNDNGPAFSKVVSVKDVLKFENSKLIKGKASKLNPVQKQPSYYLPILPKDTVRKDKEFSSNATNLPDLESHTNSNTNCESKQREHEIKSCNKNDKSNNTYNATKTQDIITGKSLVFLNAESNEYNNIKVIEKNEVQDCITGLKNNICMTKNLAAFNGKCSKFSLDNVKIDAIQGRSLLTNYHKSNEKNIKDTVIKHDALCKIVDNERHNSEGNSKKSSGLDTIIIKPLYKNNDKNNESKVFNSISATVLNIDKSKKACVRKLPNDDYYISPKKQKFSMTDDYKESDVVIKSEIIDEEIESIENSFVMDSISSIPSDSSFHSVNKTLLSSNNVVTKSTEYITSSTGKDDIIIKSEVVEEVCDSSQDTWLSDCDNGTVNSNLQDVCIKTQNSNFAESKIENESTLLMLNLLSANAKVLSEMIPSVVNQSQNKNDTFSETLNNIYKTLSSENGIDRETVKFPHDSSERDCGIVIKSEIINEICDPSQSGVLTDYKTLNSSSLNRCINKQNSNFKYEEKIKGIKNSKTFSETTNMVDVCHIKQEIEDDFEVAQTCVSVHDMEIDKCNVFTETVINDKQDISDTNCAVNSKQVVKTIDYIVDSTNKEGGIIIKSEFVEENNEALEDVCKINFDQTKTLLFDSSSTNENCNNSSRKINLRSANKNSFTKRNEALHDDFDIKPKFLKSTKTVRSNACRKTVHIKSETVYDGKTSFHNNNTNCNKPVFKDFKKCNSLEKVHLKRSSRIANQNRNNQNCQTKKKKFRRKI